MATKLATLTMAHRRHLFLSLGALALAACGTGAKGRCLALGDCGGNPSGSWTLTNGDFCQVPPVRPAQPVDVIEFSNTTPPGPPMITPPQPNPVVVQQTTSGDWCSSLVYNPDDSVSNVRLWHDAPAPTAGTFKLFEADHSYLTALTFQDHDSTTRFPPRCLVADGGHPTCEKLTTALNAFYAPAMPTVPPNFGNITCAVPPGSPAGAVATDVGCECTYVYTVVVADSGTWMVNGNTLLQDSTVFTFNGMPQSSQSPGGSIKTTFCAPGGLLQLSGDAGGSLFSIQGLRTLTLTPAPP